MKGNPKKRSQKSEDSLQANVEKRAEMPPHYREGRLKIPDPEKPVRGAGFERLRWRMNGILRNHDAPQSEDETIPSDLQYWFYEILPKKHKTKIGDKFWITPEAWRQFIDRRDFWKAEWEVVAPQRVESRANAQAKRKKEHAKKAARKRSVRKKALAPVAERAGLRSHELTAKLSRLKQIKEAGDISLFAEMILAADGWLLEAVLVGATADDCGPFFSVSDGSFDEGENFLLLWLTAAQAKKVGCRTSASLRNPRTLDLTVKDERQIALVTENILPALRGVRELRLDNRAGNFSTASLPPLPDLSELKIEMGVEESRLSITDLGKQTSLQKVTVCWECNGFGELEIDEDQIGVFERVRFEAEGFRHLNTTALTVLVRMYADYSGSESPPKWWDPRFALPDVLARVSGEVEEFQKNSFSIHETASFVTLLDASGERHRHEFPSTHEVSNRVFGGEWISRGDVLARQPFLELSASLTAKQIALITESRVPVRLVVREPTEDFRELVRLPSSHIQLCIYAHDFGKGTAHWLSDFRGEIRIYGECNADQLTPLMAARGVLWLEGRQFYGFKPEIAPVLARFQGTKIGLVCWKDLGVSFLRRLAAFSGELHLVRPGISSLSNPSKLGAEEARILVSRIAPVRVGPRFGMSAEAIIELGKKPEIGLRHYRRVLKSNQKELTLEQVYDPTLPDNHYRLKKIVRSQNTILKSSEKASRKEILAIEVKQLIEKGWEEISPEV
jgi:hypothetical protein